MFSCHQNSRHCLPAGSHSFSRSPAERSSQTQPAVLSSHNRSRGTSCITCSVAFRQSFHTSSRGVRSALAFSAEKLQPVLLSSLFLDMAQRVFVEGYPLDNSVLADLLSFNNYACRHTNVVFLSGSSLTELRWSHKSIRPWGHHLPTQCTCGAVRSWDKPKQIGTGTLLFACKSRGCTEQLTFDPPYPYTWAAKEVRGGRWMSVGQQVDD